MATPNYINDTYMAGADISASAQGAALDMRDFKSVCFNATWSTNDTPDLSIQVQVSGDATNWSDEGLAIPTLGNTFAYFRIAIIPDRYVRLNWTHAADGSTDTVTAVRVIAKV